MHAFSPYLLHVVLVSSVFLSYLSPALSFLSCLSLSLSGSKAGRGSAGHRHNLRRPAWPRGDHDMEVLCPGCPVSTPIRPCIALPWRRPAPVLPYLMWGRARPARYPITTPIRPGAALPQHRPASALPYPLWGWARPGASPTPRLPYPPWGRAHHTVLHAWGVLGRVLW
jgi:hypothetical protein